MLYDWVYVVFALFLIGTILLALHNIYKRAFNDWFLTFMWFSLAGISAMHLWGISQQTLQDEQFMARANSWLASQLADVLAWMLESWPAVTGG
jgi:hypothetical membrane protein